MSFRLLIAAGLSGCAVMIIELTATRALAPFFGSSIYTWTNVIGVVLLALALGYGLGGRLVDRRPEPRRLGMILLGGALLTAPAPFLATPLGNALLPAPTALSPVVATGPMIWGSFGAAVLLFAPPIFLLGMVSPFVTRCLVDRGVPSGAAAGRTLGISTLGSLLGTYLPAHLLIEWAGVRITLLTAAGILLAAALLLLVGTREEG